MKGLGACMWQITSNVLCYLGQIKFDPTKPDGAPRKSMDNSQMNASVWQPKVTLFHGLKLANEAKLRSAILVGTHV